MSYCTFFYANFKIKVKITYEKFLVLEINIFKYEK